MQIKVAQDIIAQDGFGGLYKGLGAGLLRQATYTTARLGIFNVLSEQLKKNNDGKVCLSPQSGLAARSCALALLVTIALAACPGPTASWAFSSGCSFVRQTFTIWFKAYFERSCFNPVAPLMLPRAKAGLDNADVPLPSPT